MSDRTTVRGGSEDIQTHLEDVPGEESYAEKDQRKEQQDTPDRDFKPASEQEVYESAERAKTDFAQASGANPEPTGDEKAPPAQQQAQERVARERQS